ncbi:2'-5' RNA ligase [Klebsiella pneumoniae]|uniref:2'-5' RNA ligase n=1 Tax=Klebsiella pneumoniae TaxID=573 RepID=A0A2X3EP04_KLEPN|nr:2'-5' RNA ligase [Klebsiella pneumoniae]
MSEPKRLFFALELPSAVQKQIVQWRATHFPEDAGRPVAADNLHLTLAFLGEVSAEKQRALAALAGRLRQPGFTLTLDDAGQWLRSRVVWLGTRQPPRGLLPARQHVARSGGAQRLLSEPAAVSPAYYPVGAMLARRCRSRPPAFAGHFR